MYKEKLNKVARKRILWENMAVINDFINFIYATKTVYLI